MAVEVKERSEIPEQYKWDLTKLYENDEKWEEALKELEPFARQLISFRGRLTESPAVLKEFLVCETECTRLLEKLFSYASLRRSEDGRSEQAQGMMVRIYQKAVQLESLISFAEPEILSMPEEQLKAFTEAAETADYRKNLERLLKRKPHTLSAAEEKLLAAAGEILAAPSEIDSMLQNIDMTFDAVKDREGNEVPVTQAGYISLQESPDRVLRENAFRSYYKSFKQHINTFGANYAASVKGDVFTASARNFPSARAMSTAREFVPESVYDGLIAAVHRYMPAMHRYAALRKEMLGLDELHYYDLYTPLVQGVDLKYSFEEAQELVLNAVKPLGEHYQEIVRSAFRDRWVDAYPNVGKSGGAYSGGCYDSFPYIMMNFTGSIDSVSTLAHEMGHSVHSYLSRTSQPPQYGDYTIFVAEVASTVNENLMSEMLLAGDITPEMRLYLLNHALEGFKGTVFRQTMFAEFEKIAHEMQEKGEALTAEALCRVYSGLVQDYFGEALVMDEEVRYEWARIPHFYSAFYVYKYATSFSAAVTLSEKILKEGEAAVMPYLRFLSLGGSEDPLDSLKIAGIDMSSPEPVEQALRKFEAILTETERVYRELKKA